MRGWFEHEMAGTTFARIGAVSAGPTLKVLGLRGTPVIEADIFEWKPARGAKFQVIYHDVGETICEDNLKEMSVLHRRFGRYLAPGGWQGSWMREELQAQAKRRSVW